MVLFRLDYNFLELLIDIVYFEWTLSQHVFRLCLYNVDVVTPDLKAVNFWTKTKDTGNQSGNRICKY